MSWTAERKINLCFGCAVALLLAMAALSYRAVRGYNEASDWVVHTQEVLHRLTRVWSNLQEAKNDSRDYVITGDPRFLPPMEKGITWTLRHLDEVRRLTKDNPQEQLRLDRLQPLLAAKIASLRRMTTMTRGPTPSPELVAAVRGQLDVDPIRKLIFEMQTTEEDLLTERFTAARRNGNQTAMVLGGGLALDFAFLAMLFAMAQRDRRARERGAQRQREERLYAESIVETVRHPLAVLTRDLRLNSANRAFYETFQVSPAEAVGLPLREIGGGQLAIPSLLDRLAVIVPEHVHLDDMEVSQDIPGGPHRVFLFNARKLFRPGNNTEHILLAIHDVSALKAKEERIQALNLDLQLHARQMEAANQEMESFSYSISHDLRAPLRHIEGFTQLLQRQIESNLDDTGRRYLSTIIASAKRLGVLIDELLRFSRMGRAEMRQIRTEMRTLVDEVLRELLPETEGRNIEWRVGSLPALRVDPTMIRQVWANLIGNAVKYTGRKPSARIEITHQNGGPEHVFSVRDNGAGFDERYSSKLFGVFQRLHSGEEFEGIGVGLANVRRIVQRHGGRTWAEGRVGEGAVFYFSLPGNAAPAQELQNPSSL